MMLDRSIYFTVILVIYQYLWYRVACKIKMLIHITVDYGKEAVFIFTSEKKNIHLYFAIKS